MSQIWGTDGATVTVTQVGHKVGLDVTPINGIGVGSYDYFAVSRTSTTDEYTFREGGSGGTVVATVTITYTDSTKEDISNVVKE